MSKLMVVYHSDTGNTERAAELVAEGARDAGAEVELLKAMDVDPQAVVAAGGVAIGSPDYYSYMAGEVKVFFDRVFHVRDLCNGKPCVCFLSHGGGGAAMESLEKLSSSVKMDCVGTLSIKGAPEGDSAEECRALGRKLAEAAKG